MRSLASTRSAPPPSGPGAGRRGPLSRLLAVAAVVLAAGLLLAACGDDGGGDEVGATDDTAADEGTGDDGTGDDGTGDDGTGDDGTADDGGGAAAVATAQTDLGEVLVDAEGYTLYAFTQDDPGTSNCYDDCATNWPPAAVEEGFQTAEGLDPAIFGTVERDDGSLQLAVKDMPLYRFAADEAPGDTNGQGVIDAWYVVAPDGSLIRDTAASGDGGGDGDEEMGGDTGGDTGGGY